ncbi:basal body-orientation factor 1 [Rhynchocyon petersi]
MGSRTCPPRPRACEASSCPQNRSHPERQRSSASTRTARVPASGPRGARPGETGKCREPRKGKESEKSQEPLRQNRAEKKAARRRCQAEGPARRDGKRCKTHAGLEDRREPSVPEAARDTQAEGCRAVSRAAPPGLPARPPSAHPAAPWATAWPVSGAAADGTLTALAPPRRGRSPPSARFPHPHPPPAEPGPRGGVGATSPARAPSQRRRRPGGVVRSVRSSAPGFLGDRAGPRWRPSGHREAPGEANMPLKARKWKGRGNSRYKFKEKDKKKAINPEESVIDRAKANASLWEARLEVTELSRIEYRDISRRLAKSNEDLKKQQYKMEKDTMSVLNYLKKQDREKDNMIEKLKQQLIETQEKAQEEKEKLEQKYMVQISELEARFHQKAKEIGMIQTELKTIRQFQKRKLQVEKELYELKENLRNTERKHQETLRRLEGRFFEEKNRLEQEAEKKIITLADKAHHEAVAQLNNAGRTVFKENVYLQKALAHHIKEANDLQKTSQKLQETQNVLLLQKEINDLLVKEKIMQLNQQKSQIQTLQKKVLSLETALICMTREFEAEILKQQQQAIIENQAGQIEMDKLQQLLEMKDKEMNRVKKLAKNILDERTEVEKFFLDSLHQVKQQILLSRKHYKQISRSAFNLKMRDACAGKAEYPKIRTFDDREHSTNSVNQDLIEAEKWSNIEGNVDIGDLTWEQKEKVLRLLFAKMNGIATRKYSQKLRPPVPDHIISEDTETKDFGDESKLQGQIFITQQVPVSDSAGEQAPSCLQPPQKPDTVRMKYM